MSKPTIHAIPGDVWQAARRALREHDADRMTCYDHNAQCCPAGDAHDFGSRLNHLTDAVTAALAEMGALR